MTTMACPHCHAVTHLGTIEKVTGIAEATRIQRGEDGTVWADYTGSTEMDWDSSTTVGGNCSLCGWEQEGGDWADKLIEVPVHTARVAAALAAFDNDPDREPHVDELVEAATTADPAALADPRVLLLTALIGNELTFSEEGWAAQLTDIFELVAEYAPRVVDGVLAEPTTA